MKKEFPSKEVDPPDMGASKRSVGEQLLRRIVRRFQRRFYPETVAEEADKAPFYEDLKLLRMAATWPAARLIRDNGTGHFDAQRYEDIYTVLIRSITLDPAEMKSRGRYLLGAVQKHWRPNWDQYGPESKAAGNVAESVLRDLRKRAQFPIEENPMAMLAAVHDALATGRPKKHLVPVAKPREFQGELF